MLSACLSAEQMAWAASQPQPGLPRLLKIKLVPYGGWGSKNWSPLERLKQQSVPRDWIRTEMGRAQNWRQVESTGPMTRSAAAPLCHPPGVWCLSAPVTVVIDAGLWECGLWGEKLSFEMRSC